MASSSSKTRPYHALKVGGRSYKLKFTANALADLEQILGEPLGAYMERFNRGGIGIRDTRALLFVALQKHHGDEVLSLDEAGELIDRHGDWQALNETLVEAYRDDFPAPAGRAAGGPKGEASAEE